MQDLRKQASFNEQAAYRSTPMQFAQYLPARHPPDAAINPAMDDGAIARMPRRFDQPESAPLEGRSFKNTTA